MPPECDLGLVSSTGCKEDNAYGLTLIHTLDARQTLFRPHFCFIPRSFVFYTGFWLLGSMGTCWGLEDWDFRLLCSGTERKWRQDETIGTFVNLPLDICDSQ